MVDKKRIALVVANPMTVRFFLLGQIRELAGRYDLTVITNADDPDFLSHLNVPVTVMPLQIERQVSLWQDLKALVHLVRIFSVEKFDLVHSHSPKAGLLAMLAAWMVRVPVRIHTFQGEVWVTRRGLWRMFLKLLDKLVAKCATDLLVVSHSEKRFLIEQGVVPEGELEILANGTVCGVDTERFKPDPSSRKLVREALGVAESDLVISYIGRLTSDKGLLDLAEAFESLSKRHRNIHLMMVGPDEEGIRERIGSRHDFRENRLCFVDYTDKPEQYMAASDIVCLPSYREGFGLVLMEAAATEIPTVGSRIYGITDAIVEGETGLLFTVGDSVDLCEKLEQLIGTPALRAELGENGRRRVCRDYSNALVLAALCQYYERQLSA